MKQPSWLALLFPVWLVSACGLPASSPKASMGKVRAGNFTVYYERHGKGAPLLLLHAGLQDHRMWAQQVEALAAQYEVITPDLPYHGQTTGLDTTLLAADVINLLLDSLGIPRASVAGLSMGSMVALDFVIAHPARVDKAVLMAPGLNGYERDHVLDSLSMAWDARFDQALQEKDTVRAAVEFTKTWATGIYRSGDSLQAPFYQYVYRTTLVNLRKHKLAGWPRLQRHPPAIDGLGTIQAPVLIIDGDKDLPLIGACSDYLARHIRGARRVKLKGVAHMLNLERPAEVNKLLLDFLGGN